MCEPTTQQLEILRFAQDFGSRLAALRASRLENASTSNFSSLKSSDPG